MMAISSRMRNSASFFSLERKPALSDVPGIMRLGPRGPWRRKLDWARLRNRAFENSLTAYLV